VEGKQIADQVVVWSREINAMFARPENSQENLDPRDSLRFREANPSEQLIVREILHEANLSFHPTNESSTSAVGEMGYTRVDVAERAGEIVAVLQWRNLGEEAEILDLAVRLVGRRQGMASFLVREFLQVIRVLGIRQAFLEVRESNAPAIALYHRFGFVGSGRRENYYRNPDEAALLLTLKIPD
jgi:ribosomal-protein-alanine N-acetyltransferase